MIRGEAGIGKTRLASELRSRASAGRRARPRPVAALDLGGTAPLSLWAELIRELLPSLPAPPADAAWPDDLAVLAAELPGALRAQRRAERGGRARPSAHPAVRGGGRAARLGRARRRRCCWCSRTSTAPTRRASSWPPTPPGGSAGLRVMMLITRRELPRSADADRLEHALRARGLLAASSISGRCPPRRSPSSPATRRASSEADIARVVERSEGNALLAVETARALAAGASEVAPSLRGSVRATLAPLVRRRSRACRDRGGRGAPDRGGRARTAAARRSRGGGDRGARRRGLLVGRRRRRSAFRHALLRDAAYEEIAEPRRRGLHHRWARALLASEQAGAIPRPAEVARHLRLAGADAEAVPQLVRAAARRARRRARSTRRPATSRKRWRSPPTAPTCGSSSASWRPGGGAATQAEAAFQRALALLDRGEPLELARAWLRRARAYHGPICVPRAVLESAGNALELLDGAAQPAPAERSEALAALAWAEAVAGSVEEAERLLARAAAPDRRIATTTCAIYDVGHARALALMRRGQFVESYGPSIAAGEAIAPRRPARPRLRLLGQRRERRDRRRRPRARARVPRPRHGGDRRARASEPRDPSARRALVRAPELGRIAEARARPSRSERSPSGSASRSWWRWPSHDRGLVALGAGRVSSRPPTLLAAVARRRGADQPPAHPARAARRRWPATGSRTRPAESCARPCSSRFARATSPTRSCRGWRASRA